jgi:L-seryl-tRNA(Ser) seleniumtransferase
MTFNHANGNSSNSNCIGHLMTVLAHLGLRPIVNAKGTATRLSGGLMRPEVSAAMVEASHQCFDMAELQAAASRLIAGATGAEAGYVASGAAACLTLAAAACMAGLDPGAMARLPDTRGLKNEIIMLRSQRNFYDHALRAAGASLVEVGLPDRFAGAGVRDGEAWELEDAITDRTAAIFYVAGHLAQPAFKDVARLARRHGLPVIVDAAAQLPPQSNLKRFIAEGAALVAFSGGKAIGGPQASGFLCGRRDLIMSAALQHLDLDVHADLWHPPASLIDMKKLKGLPPHGIGRGCKVGKEEIVGLLAALSLFIKEGDRKRHARWLTTLRAIESDLGRIGAEVHLAGARDIATVPVLELRLTRPHAAGGVALALQRLPIPVYVDAGRRDENILIINPMCVRPDQTAVIAQSLRKVLSVR